MKFPIGKWFRRSAALIFLAAALALRGQEAEPDHPFRFGFSKTLMPAVSENDYRAAMKVWAEAIVSKGLVRADPNVLLLRDVADTTEALRTHAVDGLAATTTEFFANQKQIKFDRALFGVTDGTISDEYVLLTQQDRGVTQIEDLRGKSLNVLRQPQMCLAVVWLDTLLLEKGLKPTLDFCGPVSDEKKLTQAVLPVFFRKCDACLVTRKGFQTMCELNPQLNRQLRVLATSPELVATGFFFRIGYPAAQEEKCLAEFTRVHTYAAGQQILTVFQTERMEEHPASVLDSALALLNRHQQLLGETNSFPAIAAIGARVETNGVAR